MNFDIGWRCSSAVLKLKGRGVRRSVVAGELDENAQNQRTRREFLNFENVVNVVQSPVICNYLQIKADRAVIFSFSLWEIQETS
jgi:hypothetical protein